MAKGYISFGEAAYVQALLEDLDPENKKSGLQRLCKLYRSGLSLRYPHPIRQILNALLYNESSKVRRWALSAIALAGKSSDNLDSVIGCIERFRNDPEIVVAGVPALFGLVTPQQVGKLLKYRQVPLEGATLVASAQYSESHRRQLRRSKINIERADALELRMGTLLVGMNKAPENLFDAKHLNRSIIGQLNGHDDELVAQYSVWAIAENPGFGVNDLTISLKNTESLRPNVRGWVYRLVAADDATASENVEYIVLGSQDESNEAREGLAIGLRNVFFDGLDETTYRWLADEPIPRIRDRLLEHMAASAEKCPGYLTPVVEIYRGSDRATQIRLEGAAQGTSTYSTLRRIAIATEQTSLNLGGSNGVTTMVVQNINTGGGNIGAVTGQGPIIAESIQVVSQMKEGDPSKQVLTELLKFIQNNVRDEGQKRLGAEAIKAAAASPSKLNMQKVLGWLQVLSQGSGYIDTASHSIGDLIHHVGTAIQHMAT